MAKEKKSFFERLTGAKSVEGSEFSGVPVYNETEETTVVMREEPASFPVREEESWATPSYSQSDNESAEGQLTIDVYQTENEIVIKSTIAGVKPEDLDVSINNDMVTVKGERKNEEEVSHGNYYYQECYWGKFSRSVILPQEIDPEGSFADFKNGILTVHLPKLDRKKTRKLKIRMD
jgi:HSP20 family protein